MRFRNLVVTAAVAAALAGCTNETLDSVNISNVKNKTEYQLSSKMVSKMRELGMQKSSPILLRIFKEEGTLEVWKANTASRFQLLKSYKICAWSGKLGPKVKEGDRQAPEGFYPLYPHQMNPNSSYYLAINTGYPNAYDKANNRSGTHLMIHGACSSSGCYSMTDEQIIEIFALARDAFRGGQENIQLQAFPFRMTAENMARHRDNPNIEFWKMLKAGYDQFEVTKRPPQVNVCERKYVFNQQSEGTFNPAGQCPAMSSPPALQVAMANYENDYKRDYDKALKKFEGMVWYEPTEAERKAVVAEQRKGRELAYAPTGTSLDAGKLIKVSDLERKLAEEKQAEEARQATLIQKEALERTTREGGTVPVPQPNPVARPVEQATLQTAPARRSFWNLFSNGDPVTPRPPAQAQEQVAGPPAPAQQPAASDTAASASAAENPQVATAPAGGGQAIPAEQPAPEQPKKRPFWKIWGN